MFPGITKPLAATVRWSLAWFLILGISWLAGSAAAGEGGTSHLLPGATATLIDLPGTSAAWFAKPMYLNYHGTQSAMIPTAAGLVANLDATANILALAAGRTFEQTVLGGAHYTFAIALPYTWLDVSGNVQLPGGGTVARHNEVSGFGDMAVLPVMLAWKTADWHRRDAADLCANRQL